MGKVCISCKKDKQENEFYKLRKHYLRSNCITCYNVRAKTYKRKKSFDSKCFRCGIDFKCANKSGGYCSRKCMYEGMSLRVEHEHTLGIRSASYNCK